MFKRGSNHDEFLACDPIPEIVLEEMQKNIEQKSLSELELSLLHYESKNTAKRAEERTDAESRIPSLPAAWLGRDLQPSNR